MIILLRNSKFQRLLALLLVALRRKRREARSDKFKAEPKLLSDLRGSLKNVGNWSCLEFRFYCFARLLDVR